jgi:hypothetical protein
MITSPSSQRNVSHERGEGYSDIGIIQAGGGVFTLTFQILMYPSIAKKLKLVGTFRWGIVVGLPGFILMPEVNQDFSSLSLLFLFEHIPFSLLHLYLHSSYRIKFYHTKRVVVFDNILNILFFFHEKKMNRLVTQSRVLVWICTGFLVILQQASSEMTFV